MRLLNTILDTIFPVNCMACGKNGADLCMECLEGSPPAERESAKWIFPLYDYRHPPVKKALRLFKYKGKKKLAAVFARALAERMLEELAELQIMENFQSPLLVPIPLSKKRYRERGYNQAELIGRELEKIFNARQNVFGQTFAQAVEPSKAKIEHNFMRGEPENILLGVVNNILIKPKDTEHQARLENRKERMRNIVGTFGIQNPELVRGRNIILLDDIVTTGATLSEARRVLKEAGARKIIAFAVAH